MRALNKRLRRAIISLAMLACACPCAKATEQATTYKADEFPITFWAFSYLRKTPDRYKRAITDEQYALITNCNFNLMIGGPQKQAEKFNVKYISCALRTKEFKALWWPPYDRPIRPKLIKQMTDAIKSVDQSSPALWGYCLADEPGKVLYPRVAWYYAIMKSIDPDHHIFVNCLPGTDPEAFIKIVQPDIIAYDKYPIFNGGSNITKINDKKKPSNSTSTQGCFDTSSFLYSLSRFRKAALAHNKLFIPTMLATGHYLDYEVDGEKYHRDYGKVSDAKLRWQAYSALAYNADGIAWFVYFTSENKTYEPAAIGWDWKPTPIYYWLKKVNAEVFAIGHILKTLKSVAVYETKPLYFWRKYQEAYVDLFPGKGIIKNCKGSLATVSEFTDGSKGVYLIVVNRNIKNEGTLEVDLEWEQVDRILIFDKEQLEWGLPIWKKGDERVLRLKLLPGDGQFIKVELTTDGECKGVRSVDKTRSMVNT